MYAVDSSTFIAYLRGESAPDTSFVKKHITSMEIALPPAVITEVLSNKETRHLVESQVRRLYQLSIDDDYWYSASALRASVLAKSYKARIPDTLIAQSCIDHDVPLITRDNDFRHFAEIGGLKLAAK